MLDMGLVFFRSFSFFLCFSFCVSVLCFVCVCERTETKTEKAVVFVMVA